MTQETVQKDVLVYTKPNCVPCANTKAFLKENGIPFEEKNVVGKANKDNLREFKTKGYDNIPVIEITHSGEMDVISGFQKEALRKALHLEPTVDIQALNEDIKLFPSVYPITEDMVHTFSGISQMVMLDRYSFKDVEKKTLKEGDMVILTVQEDPKYPVRGIGFIETLLPETNEAVVYIKEEYRASLSEEEQANGRIKRKIETLDKPLEVVYEQIAKRNAHGLAANEAEEKRGAFAKEFFEELSNLHFIPAGRVLYGVGSGSEVTLFNCFVMPMPRDSREGLGEHRQEVMEIMSRGGGVGTNGSTLRPRDALAKGVNGKSSGSVSWMDDLAKLTHLVQQGGSR